MVRTKLKYVNIFLLIVFSLAAQIDICFGQIDNKTNLKKHGAFTTADENILPHVWVEKFSALHKDENFKGLIEFGELLGKQNINDTSVGFFMGLAYYHLNNKKRALEVMNNCLQHNDFTDEEVKGKAVLIDRALVYYRVHEIYNEFGNVTLARESLNKAKKLMRLRMGEKYEEEKMMMFFCRRSIKNKKYQRCITYTNGKCDETACDHDTSDYDKQEESG